MVSRTPLQIVKEARQIARDHNMKVVECATQAGIDYVLYRRLPNGTDERLGKRSTPQGIRHFVCKCAKFH